MTPNTYGAWIDGAEIDAEDGARFAVHDPSTGEVIARVADCTAADARNAVASAAQAFPAWAAMPAITRARLLQRWADLLTENADRLAGILTAENGKPLAEARGEVLYGASYLEWFAGEARRAYGETMPAEAPGERYLVIRQPVGVCGVITPWNFPNAMLLRKVAAALAAGCTVVAKPAAETPLSALEAAKLASEAGLPRGVLNITPTSRAADIGQVLTGHEAVRKLSFTGSTHVGKSLMAQSSASVQRVSMELGGNAPFIVFEDADLDAAVAGAIASKFRNAGQTCVCANRFIVHDSIADTFAHKLAAAAQRLVVADGRTPGAQIGPLISDAAVTKVKTLISEAVSAGARLLAGGGHHALAGRFFQPTVLDQVTPAMSIASEEIFGPVAPIISFRDDAQALAMANATPYGLAAYLYTRDLQRAFTAGEALECGMVGINTGLISTAAAPFGGVKQSGFGREGSRHGLDDYTTLKFMKIGAGG